MSKINHKKGDVVGKYEYVYLKNIDNNKKSKYALFRCDKHNTNFTTDLYSVRRNFKSCPICKQFRIEHEKDDLIGPNNIKFIKYKYKKINQRYAFFECPVCERDDWYVCICTIKNGSSSKCKKCIIVHGCSETKAYIIWTHMISRCYNKNNKHYKNYGGRGITVCNEWLGNPSGIVNFCKWVYEDQKMTDDTIGKGKDRFTIDRKDNDKGYYPNNCKFSNCSEQTQNTRLLNSINTSGFRGVSWYKKYNKWLSRISLNNKRYNLGYCKSRLKAAIAFNNFIKENNTSHPLNKIDNLSIINLQLNTLFYNSIKRLDLVQQINLFDYIFKHMDDVELIKKHLIYLDIKIDNRDINIQLGSIRNVVKNPLLTDYIFKDIIYIIK